MIDEQKKKKIGILLFQQFHGRRNVGSSRIRGEWLIHYWPEAELFQMGGKYEVVIYQKAYFVDHAKAFNGVKIFDICDADFLHWGYRTKEMLEEVDAVTTSTEALAEVFRKFTDKPVVCIPDRVDLDSHKEKKYHSGKAKNVVWFGYSTGFDILKPAIHFIKKFGLGLIVISESPFVLPSLYAKDIELRNLPWNIETVNTDILKGDIVINPQSTKGKWKYKSNNKTLTAWALGMPVAHNVEELERFIDVNERRKECVERLKEIKEKWDVKKSVLEFQNLIKQIEGSKTNKTI